MFARRRKRTEEEPLVPHGLVGQATEQADQSASVRGEVILFPPIVAAIPQLAIPQVAADDSSPAKVTPLSSADSTRPKPTEIKITTRHTAATRAIPISQAASSELGAAVNPAPEARRTLAMLLQSDFSRVLENKQAFVRSVAAMASRWVTRARNELAQVSEWLRSEQVRAKVFDPIEEAVGTYKRSMSSTANYGVRIRRWLSSRQIGLVVRYRNATVKRVRVRLHWPSMPDSWHATTEARIRQLRPHGQILLARLKAEWILQRRRFAADSRAWTSLAMGAICAVLALAFISAVRHYAIAALPSNQNFRQPNATSANSAQPVILSPTLKPAAKSAGKATEGARTEAIKKTPVPAPKNSAPKARRKMDDDYVAKDTYVVYDRQTRSH
jgi:hypothetical protein